MKFLIVLIAVIAITVADFHINEDGSYKYSYEGENLSGNEEGLGGSNAHGSYKFTSPEGEHFEITYTADENGYQPHGSHIHAIPEAILRSLEYNKAHPEK